MKTAYPECMHCKSRSGSLLHFCHLDELSSINADKRCTTFKRGQTLFHEGTMPGALYCVNEGKIKLHKMGSDGKEQIVRLVKPGDFIGYRALMSDSPYSASATALEDAIVCLIPRPSFFNLLKENDAVSEGMMKLLCRNLEESEKKLTEMAYKPVRERLAEALLLLKRTYAEENQQGDFTIAISREDLASLVGTAKETVIRLLSEMKDEKIVKAEGRKITLLNDAALTKIANMYD